MEMYNRRAFTPTLRSAGGEFRFEGGLGRPYAPPSLALCPSPAIRSFIRARLIFSGGERTTPATSDTIIRTVIHHQAGRLEPGPVTAIHRAGQRPSPAPAAPPPPPGGGSGTTRTLPRTGGPARAAVGPPRRAATGGATTPNPTDRAPPRPAPGGCPIGGGPRRADVREVGRFAARRADPGPAARILSTGRRATHWSGRVA